MALPLSLLVALLAVLTLSGCNSEDEKTPVELVIRTTPDKNPVKNENIKVLGTGEVCQKSEQCKEDGDVCAPSRSTPDIKVCKKIGADSGAPCAENRDCEDGECITDGPFKDKGGYCSKKGCEKAADCASNHTKNGLKSLCLTKATGGSRCVSSCKANGDCRAGYSCIKRAVEQADALGYCQPSSIGRGEPIQLSGEECKEINKDGYADFTYQIPSNAISYHIMARSVGGNAMVPFFIQVADQPKYYLPYHKNAEALPLIFSTLVSPSNGLGSVLIPIAPKFNKLLGNGKSVALRVLGTQNDQVCVTLIPKTKPGKTLNANVYLVGVDSLKAATAATHPGLQRALNQVRTIYGKKGYKLGDIHYHDVSPEVESEFQVLKGKSSTDRIEPFHKLVQNSKPPADQGEDSMSINIFIVKRIEIGGGSTLGVSSGLPGFAGIHGSSYSGVVFTSEYLDNGYFDYTTGKNVNGPDYTGVIMAHEIGHFIGLFHTSEAAQPGAYDPIPDTPACKIDQLDVIPSCPDLTNLMFPYAGIDHVNMTNQQAEVFSKSLLFQPAAQD